MTNGRKQMCGECGQKSGMKNKKSAQKKLKNSPSPDDDDDSEERLSWSSDWAPSRHRGYTDATAHTPKMGSVVSVSSAVNISWWLLHHTWCHVAAEQKCSDSCWKIDSTAVHKLDWLQIKQLKHQKIISRMLTMQPGSSISPFLLPTGSDKSANPLPLWKIPFFSCGAVDAGSAPTSPSSLIQSIFFQKWCLQEIHKSWY